MTAFERTGWRDEELSLEHRRWGVNLPAVDIDFLWLEYDRARPVVLVDYKYRPGFDPLAHTETFAGPSYDAVSYLATAASIQSWVVVYDREPWRFRVYPLNAQAHTWWQTREGLDLSHQEFIQALYRVRFREPPPEDALWRMTYGRPRATAPP